MEKFPQKVIDSYGKKKQQDILLIPAHIEEKGARQKKMMTQAPVSPHAPVEEENDGKENSEFDAVEKHIKGCFLPADENPCGACI